MKKPLCIDLYAGLGGWAEGFLAEGYRVVGFDIERHDYGTGGYPGQLVLQDALTLHGSQFRDAAVIVASPPCQEFSYMAMPWSRAKQIAKALEGHGEFPEGYTGSRTVEQLTALFDCCFRIQREAEEAAGRHIPLIVENVRGAQRWVGRAKANYGSYFLWGDVGMVGRRVVARLEYGNGVAPKCGQHKVPGFRFDGSGGSFQTASVKFKTTGPSSPEQSEKYNCHINEMRDALKTSGHVNQRDGHTHARHLTNQAESDAVLAGVKQPGISAMRANGKGDRWFQDGAAQSGSKSGARKAASAAIAKIPFPLANHIARAFRA